MLEDKDLVSLLTRWRVILLGAIAPPLSLYLARYLGDWGPNLVLSVGGFFQILGLFTVGIGLHRVRSRFSDSPGFLEEAKRRLGETLRRITFWREPKPQVLHGQAAISGTSAMSGRLTVGPNPKASIEERLAYLENALEEQRAELRELERHLRDQIHDLQTDLNSERQGRVSADRENEELIKELATGGLRLEAVGLLWLLWGVFFSIWSNNIALFVP